MSRFNNYLFVPRSELRGIGSTDARRIAAGDWDTLFDEKTGARQPEDLTHVWKPRLGLETESLHAWWHGLKECKNLVGPQLLEPPCDSNGKSHAIVGMVLTDDSGMADPTRPSMFTSIDRWVVEDECPLEMKHTHGQNNLRAAAEYYMGQVQWQMMVLAVDRLRFSIICGNAEPEWGYVAADPDYQRRLKKQADEFWRMVESGTRPLAADPDPVLASAAKTIPINGMRSYDHTNLPSANAFIAKALDYIALKPKADEFKAVQEELKALVPADAIEVNAGGLTAKRDKRGALRWTINE